MLPVDFRLTGLNLTVELSEKRAVLTIHERIKMSKIGYFLGFQNRKLLARTWENKKPWNGKILILLHRGHEHSERLDDIANYAEFDHFKKYSYDYRGHGHEKGEFCYEFMDLVRDLDCFVKFVQEDAGVHPENLFVIANSVAGVVSATWIHDYAPKIAGIALIAPAFKIKLYVPFAKAGLALLTKIRPKLHIKSYVKSKFLTHDIDEQKKYNTDKLITPDIPAAQLVSLLNTAQRVVDNSAMITVPTLILSAEQDYIVDNAVQRQFYDNLSSSIKKIIEMPKFFHGILYEKDKHIALSEINDFINQCFSDNDKTDYLSKLVNLTQLQKDNMISEPISFFDACSYSLQRVLLKHFGSVSHGIRVGKKYGFDSGVTLDYVYHNTPQGFSFIGKMIDKNYLNSIGWKGIRIRKINLESLLEKSIAEIQSQNRDVKILDIAGGPAKYLVEMAKKHQQIQILVRDYQQQNIDVGNQYIEQHKLKNIAYEQADAFNPTNYSNANFEPNIVVISGVFELFESNELIQKAIDGASSLLKSGDILLFTNQPFHPQLAQISNVLMNHQNEKWSMRIRSQYEINRLFSNSGFEIEEMLIDDCGIFSVTKARKK